MPHCARRYAEGPKSPRRVRVQSRPKRLALGRRKLARETVMRGCCPTGKSALAFRRTAKRVQPLSQKFSAFAVGQINFRTPAVSCPPEGRIAIVTTRWARDAMDAAAPGSIIFGPDERAAAYGKVVWSWRRDAGVKFAGRSFPRMTVATKPAHRGEHEGNR